jgi:hypothetical protein
MQTSTPVWLSPATLALLPTPIAQTCSLLLSMQPAGAPAPAHQDIHMAVRQMAAKVRQSGGAASIMIAHAAMLASQESPRSLYPAVARCAWHASWVEPGCVPSCAGCAENPCTGTPPNPANGAYACSLPTPSGQTCALVCGTGYTKTGDATCTRGAWDAQSCTGVIEWTPAAEREALSIIAGQEGQEGHKHMISSLCRQQPA